jgi:hypothetical protein
LKDSSNNRLSRFGAAALNFAQESPGTHHADP